MPKPNYIKTCASCAWFDPDTENIAEEGLCCFRPRSVYKIPTEWCSQYTSTNAMNALYKDDEDEPT